MDYTRCSSTFVPSGQMFARDFVEVVARGAGSGGLARERKRVRWMMGN